MIGKGSVNHNNRRFIANNVDAERTENNILFCNDNIKDVYHQLFDEAQKKYNDKQTRDDRRIEDYYVKIRTGKQEKLFHEVIFQVGNKDDMNARDENGQLAKTILTDFMNNFQERNPQLRVFSAHLHMDEETPHLHIDFVPFTTGSKRGLETRVSLKKALAQQGYTGDSRSETEWNKWVQAEKEELALVMEKHKVIWKELGTHRPHLDVLDFKKQEREKEVVQLEKEIVRIEDKLSQLKEDEEFVSLNVDKYYNNDEWQVPQPQPLMNTKTYKEKLIDPLVDSLKSVIKSVISAYLRMRNKYRDLQYEMDVLKSDKNALEYVFKGVKKDNAKLSKNAEDYKHLREAIGSKKTDEILEKARADHKKKSKKIDYER
ncbi:MAG: plasmid recombination protein [Eubacteriales bacterium]